MRFFAMLAATAVSTFGAYAEPVIVLDPIETPTEIATSDTVAPETDTAESDSGFAQ